MKYLSVCSGIEACSVAWAPLGWEPLAFAEIADFPRAVLAHHHPGVPLYGDFTEIRRERWIVDADMLVGGTPCQSFSIAGLRESLDDDRGNLCLEFVRLADAVDDLRRGAGREPAWVLWENVPGVLSVEDNAFGALLGGLVGGDAPVERAGGGGWPRAGVVAGPRRVAAWRVMDAQHFGLAQRRERVFVLALGGDRAWSAADALLPLIESRTGHPAPSRGARSSAAPGAAGGAAYGGGRGGGMRDVSTAMTAHGRRQDFDSETFVTVGPLLAGGGERGHRIGADEAAAGHIVLAVQDCGPKASGQNGAGVGGDLAYTVDTTGRQGVATMPRVLNARQDPIVTEDLAQPLDTNGGSQAVAFAENSRAELRLEGGDGSRTGALSAGGGKPGQGVPMVAGGCGVRRLLPVEGERLQGFPDDHTRIPWRGKPAEACPDAPRYRAIGNSMAVTVVRYIGQRVDAVRATWAATREAA